MLNAIIIDDEPGPINTLRAYLEKYRNFLQLAGTSRDPNEGLQLIQSIQPDLVFLDIQMPGMTGFQLLEKLDKQSFKLVFVTAYDQYALNAIKAGAYDYLLKPVAQDEFDALILRIVGEELAASASDSENAEVKPVGIKTKNGYQLIPPDEIILAQAEGSYTHLVTAVETHVVSRNLKHISSLLPESGFLRINRSQLINLNHIRFYERANGGSVILSNGTTCSIGTQNHEMLVALIEKRFSLI